MIDLPYATAALTIRTFRPLATSDVQAILAHFFMLVIWVTALTLVVIIQITVMTKRILRAIELASKK